MKAIKLKDLKRGDYFTYKLIEAPSCSRVYVRGDYDRSSRKYLVYKFDDINDYRLKKGDLIVYVDFIF